MKNKNISGNGKELATVLGADQETQKSLIQAIPQNVANLVKTFPGIIVHQHTIVPKQMALLKERYAELKLCCCNLAWMKNNDDLRGESDGSQPSDTSTGDGEARNHFWTIAGNCFCRHHVEPGVKHYVPKEEPFPVPIRLHGRCLADEYDMRRVVGKQ